MAQHLRTSIYTYPLVNAAHIAGIALLFGAIVPVDLRLLGLWRSVPAAALLRTSRLVAAFGLVLAITMGLLLFSARAVEYAAQPVFQAKVGLIAVALLNLGLTELALRQGARGRVGVHAGLSIALWLAVILAGRAIAYFE